MARHTKRLSARAVQTIKTPGRHADGDGLYLVVDASGARRWLFLFRWNGKLKEMGLGGFSSVSLAEARSLAADARKRLTAGENPIEVRREERRKSTDKATFGDFADALVDEIEAGFRNEKHRAQWRMTLKSYAAPLRDLPVDAIDTDAVLGVLRPIWLSKNETASRVRGRIERVLDAARARGLRSGENPARWRGHLNTLLPPAPKLARGHHAAMPYPDVPALMARLRAIESDAARALEFCILTATRTSETLNAEWDEIDLKENVWTIPGERMKAGRPHRVPLAAAAIRLLRAQDAVRRSKYVFAGQAHDRPLSGMAMAMTLRRLGHVDATVHGFRSSFRDWCAEQTQFARETAEEALAHIVGDTTERAYRRGDALEKRRVLMGQWAAFVTSGRPAGDVPDIAVP